MTYDKIEFDAEHIHLAVVNTREGYGTRLWLGKLAADVSASSPTLHHANQLTAAFRFVQIATAWVRNNRQLLPDEGVSAQSIIRAGEKLCAYYREHAVEERDNTPRRVVIRLRLAGGRGVYDPNDPAEALFVADALADCGKYCAENGFVIVSEIEQ